MTIPSHAELLREYLEQLSKPGSRLPVWKDWLKLRVGGAMALGAALALTACDDSDDQTGNLNQGGAAGATQVAGAGGSANTDPVALYAAPMGGDSNAAGGIGAGTLYGIAMGSQPGAGGSSSSTGAGGVGAGTRYAAPIGGDTAGGSSSVALYAIAME